MFTCCTDSIRTGRGLAFGYLHLDVQHHDLALGRLLLDGRLAGPVAVAAELGVLDEPVLRDQVLERLHRHEVVVHAVLLALARLARRVRYREREGVGVRCEELAVQCALADAGRARDDEGPPVGWRCCAEVVSSVTLASDGEQPCAGWGVR